eukprot:COSAG06_NODE_34304_length_476_cov_5.976127_1_plen_40_part_01
MLAVDIPTDDGQRQRGAEGKGRAAVAMLQAAAERAFRCGT